MKSPSESSLKTCKNPNCSNPVIQPRYIYTEKPKEFCCHKCYLDNKSLNKLSPNELKEQSIQKAIDKGEKAFAGKKENDDYLVCLICGCKTAALSIHVKMHGITPTEYKTKYNLDKLVLEKFRKCGKDNPGYQHGGKYSVWSEKFVKGYDKDRHLELSNKHSKFQTDNPNNIFSRAAYDSDEEYLKFQTKDLDFFVNRYGVEEGTNRYNEKTRKWIESFPKLNYSKVSQELFHRISSIYDGDVFYATHNRDDMSHYQNKEYKLKCLDSSWVSLDFVDMNTKKIIEFDGDYWHGEAKGNQQRDMLRDQKIKDSGFSILHILERDYKRDPEKELQKCINFLTQ